MGGSERFKASEYDGGGGLFGKMVCWLEFWINGGGFKLVLISSKGLPNNGGEKLEWLC